MSSSWDYGTYHIGDQEKAQASLRIRAVSPEPLLFAHIMEVDEKSDQKSDT